MKRSIMILSIAIMAIDLVAAQQDISGSPAPLQQGGSSGAPAEFAPPRTTTLNGFLAFANEKPVIRTDGRDVFLAMPEFYKYAYFAGFKAGIAVKATGFIIVQQEKDDKAAQSTLFAKEVVIGETTYIIVGSGPNDVRRDPRRPNAQRGFDGSDDDKMLNHPDAND